MHDVPVQGAVRPAVRPRGLVLVMLYVTVYLSYMHAHLQSPIISPYAASLGAGLVLTGFIVGSYSLSNIFGNLLSGYYIDTLGRKSAIMVGLALAGIAVSLYGVARTPSWLLAFRLLHGLAGGILVPATLAYIGDVSPEGQRGKGMALYGAAIGIAAVTGPVLGGLVRGKYGFGMVFVLTLVLALVGLGTTGGFLVETLDREAVARRPRTRSTRWHLLWTALTRRRLIAAYLLAFAIMFNKGVLAFVLPLRTESMGLSPGLTGMFFGFYGFFALLVQALPTNRISDRVGREVPGLGGVVAMGLSLLALSLVSSTGGTFVVMALFGLGFGIGFPAMTAIVADETDPEERGTASGVFAAVYSLGVVVGPPLTAALLRPLGPVLGDPLRTTTIVTVLVALATAAVLRRDLRTRFRRF
ncbi:MAG: MFS transporter [Bacillota bacterium]